MNNKQRLYSDLIKVIPFFVAGLFTPVVFFGFIGNFNFFSFAFALVMSVVVLAFRRRLVRKVKQIQK